MASLETLVDWSIQYMVGLIPCLYHNINDSVFRYLNRIIYNFRMHKKDQKEQCVNHPSRPDEQVGASPLPSVYECVCQQVNIMHNLCKVPWTKALYKCTVYHLCIWNKTIENCRYAGCHSCSLSKTTKDLSVCLSLSYFAFIFLLCAVTVCFFVSILFYSA